jgi:glycosyltransferase involved in cell wall biosynthesis
MKVRPITLEIALTNIEHVNWRTEIMNIPPAVVELMQQQNQWSSRELLAHTGWNVVDARSTCGDLDSYRTYIQCSKAEWSVAKNGYVQGRSGWFSERSACYLASGRPVVVQDTGFPAVLPVGEGIFAFKTIEDASAAIEKIEANYASEAKAAREIAEEYFDSEKVLTRLIEEALISDGMASNSLTVRSEKERKADHTGKIAREYTVDGKQIR